MFRVMASHNNMHAYYGVYIIKIQIVETKLDAIHDDLSASFGEFDHLLTDTSMPLFNGFEPPVDFAAHDLDDRDSHIL